MDKPFWTSTIRLYCSATGLESHRLRLLLGEKDVPCDVKIIGDNWPSQLETLNPTRTLPFLTDKRLFLHGPAVDEFLNDRFPHPNLLPFDAVDRARARFLVQEVIGWYGLPPMHQYGKIQEYAEALWSAGPWFLGDDFSIIDVAAAPLLWIWRHHLLSQPKHMQDYAARLFSRPAMESSLTQEQVREDVGRRIEAREIVMETA